MNKTTKSYLNISSSFKDEGFLSEIDLLMRELEDAIRRDRMNTLDCIQKTI